MDPICKTFVTDHGISRTIAGGFIPEFVEEASTVTVTLDIDTPIIQNSAAFHTAGATECDFAIKFCVKVELLNEAGLEVTMENTIITFQAETSQPFEIVRFAAEPDVATVTVGQFLANFPLDKFLCYDNNVEVVAPAMKPGDAIQFCVSTSSAEAAVENLRDVKFLNSMDDSAAIPLIRKDYFLANEQTSINCAAGVCRVTTTAYARLFEKVEDDGTITAINTGAKIAGETVLKLTTSGRMLSTALDEDLSLQESEQGSTNFDLDVDLAAPRSCGDSSGSSSSAFSVISTIGGLLGGLVISMPWPKLNE